MPREPVSTATTNRLGRKSGRAVLIALATEQVPRLLRHADAQRVAVLASPRGPAVAAMYRRLGFQPVAPGRGRMLIRWPRCLPGSSPDRTATQDELRGGTGPGPAVTEPRGPDRSRHRA